MGLPATQLCSLVLVALGSAFAFSGLAAWHCPWFWHVPAPFALGAIPIVFFCDRLSCVFLVLLGVVTACCGLFSTHYLQHLAKRINPRLYWSAVFIFVAAMAAVLCATNAVVFLVAWETMSLSSAALVLSEFRLPKAQKAAMIYLTATRIATAFLCAGFLVMYAFAHSFDFSAWSFHASSTWLAAGLILLGLAIKTGIWPFHIWLPYAHPEAPSPVSAMMSGVMVKVAIYAAIRLLIVGGLNCAALAYGAFALSCISAFWGVLFAINQRELKRLLAYSTVENVSLIAVAISVCLWARSAGLVNVAEIALTGALLHSIAHGLFKSLLFLNAGAVDYAAHTRQLADLGGLAKRMPYTGVAFITGCAAICAFPPLNGFGSKWYLYQGLLSAAIQLHNPVDRSICLAAVGVLACCGALAVACFAKAAGVAFLGNPRSKRAAEANEVAPSMLGAQFVLMAGCIGGGLFTPRLAALLKAVVAPAVAGSDGLQAVSLANPINFTGMAIVVASAISVFYACVLLRRPNRYRTWDCGFGAAGVLSQVTADSFAQPIARMFTPVLRHSLAVDISGRDRRHFPERIHVRPSMVSLLETKIYQPAARTVARFSQLLAKLQAGSIHLYLGYVCIALIVVVFLGTLLW